MTSGPTAYARLDVTLAPVSHPPPLERHSRGALVAKKAKARKRTAQSRQPKAKKAPKKATSTRPAKRRSSAKRAQPKPKPTRASKTKNAARSAGSRNDRKPEPQPSRLLSAAKIAAGVALLAFDGVAKRMPWAKNENDPIALLEADHRHFEKLLDEGEQTTDRAKKGRREILTALTSELNVHEAIEERVFYPALKPHAEAHDLVLESFQEHHVADTLLKELHEVALDDEQWGAKFKVLKENVAHHISDEEYKLFPVARGVLKKEELLALGKAMRELKAELER
jgi:hypothetical protein